MNTQDIFERICSVIQSALQHSNIPLSPDTAIESIEGWGSIENAMIITAIEQEFGIKFKLRELLSWHTLGELTDLIQSKLG